MESPSKITRKVTQTERVFSLTPSGSKFAQVKGKGLRHLNANTPKEFQSTPRYGSPTKRLQLSDDCSPITRKARRCEIVKVSKLVDAFVQTDSNCDCDFYDENGLEMMASTKAEPEYYGKLAEKIQPEVESVQKKNEQLSNILEKRKVEVSELQTTVDVLYEVIDDYTEGNEEVIGSTKETASTSFKNDSGVHETSAAESIGEDMKTSYKPGHASKGVAVQSNIQSPRKGASAELKYKNKVTSSKFVQASTCCTCDLSEDEQVGMMLREKKNELDHLYDVNRMRMVLVSTREINEVLETEIAEEEEKLNVLQLLRGRLLSRAENAELLSNMCNSSSYICNDSGLANETEDSPTLNTSILDFNVSTTDLNSTTDFNVSTTDLNSTTDFNVSTTDLNASTTDLNASTSELDTSS